VRKIFSIAAVLVGGVIVVAHGQGAQPAPTRIAIRAAQLIDGQGGAPVRDAVVVIEGERIVAAGSKLTIPAGAEVIDLGGATLLPGLIDAHTHITGGDPRDYYEKIFRRSAIDKAVEAHVYAQRTLEAGFTTVRDVGADEYVDIALRKAIDAGVIAGPRMQVASMGIGATGGHADLTGFSPYIEFHEFSSVADGVDEIRKAGPRSGPASQRWLVGSLCDPTSGCASRTARISSR
jgi:imidazolonepropionase-like amidohydrolase